MTAWSAYTPRNISILNTSNRKLVYSENYVNSKRIIPVSVHFDHMNIFMNVFLFLFIYLFCCYFTLFQEVRLYYLSFKRFFQSDRETIEKLKLQNKKMLQETRKKIDSSEVSHFRDWKCSMIIWFNIHTQATVSRD